MKNILIIAASLIVLGIMLMIGGWLLAGRTPAGFNSKNNQYVEKTYECKDNIDNIILKESSTHVTVRSGDVDKVTVDYFDNKDRELYDIKEENGTLYFTRNSEKSFVFFSIDLTEKATVITVPRDYKGALDLNSSSGGMELNDLTGSDIKVENTSGSIQLEGITGDTVSVKNTSGSIRLENVALGTDMSVENTSGSIKLNSVDAGGSISIKGSSGGIRLDSLKAGGDINIKNTSGSVKGTIIGKESDYKVNAEVTSGSCNLENSDSGNKELNVKTTSGGINIEFVSQ